MRYSVAALVLAAGLVVSAPETGAQESAGSDTTTATPAARADTVGRVIFTREVYSYPRDGRRDPFASLIATGDIRPIFSDLVITGITYDPTGRNSVAMLLDVSTQELYRARVGSVFGRLRITSIRRTDVQFAIDEFGHTRQESLSINATSPAERTP